MEKGSTTINPQGKSFFIIKPEAFNQRVKIKKLITKNSRLKIVATKVVKLTEKDIDTLYTDDIKTPLMNAIKRQLINARVEVDIVAGSNAVRGLAKVCGINPFPGDCTIGTVREKFGKREPLVVNGLVYYLNAIHKASPNEAEPSINWFNSKK